MFSPILHFGLVSTTNLNIELNQVNFISAIQTLISIIKNFEKMAESEERAFAVGDEK